jgi:hypothetical protein
MWRFSIGTRLAAGKAFPRSGNQRDLNFRGRGLAGEVSRYLRFAVVSLFLPTYRGGFEKKYQALSLGGKRRWKTQASRRVARLSRAAAMVASISESVWAAETKRASYWDGGRKIPRRSISWKNTPKRAVSDFWASR